MSDATITALKQVDERRRSFLGKLLTGGAAVATLPTMSSVVLGEDRRGGGKGKGGPGGGDGKGKGGGRPDPAQMAARMIATHDKDNDGALNARELAAALQAMMSQRGGQGKGQGGGRGKGKGGARNGGGARPKRPNAE
jgi:hypothetical protein